MTKARHELSWNSDAKIPNGKPKGGFKSQNGFTINTGVVNQIDNEPVSYTHLTLPTMLMV